MKDKFFEKKYIIFDFDGTLVQSELPWQDLKKSLISLGEDYHINLENVPLTEIIYTLHYTPAKQKVLNEIESFEITHNNKFIMNQLTQNIIKSLARDGYKLAIFSNNFKQTIQQVFSDYKMLSLFDIIIGRKEVKFYKPIPEGLIKIIDYWKCSRNDMVFIGDNELDKKAATIVEIDYYSINDFLNLFKEDLNLTDE